MTEVFCSRYEVESDSPMYGRYRLVVVTQAETGEEPKIAYICCDRSLMVEIRDALNRSIDHSERMDG